jgi:cation diffusion facilitator family transporter
MMDAKAPREPTLDAGGGHGGTLAASGGRRGPLVAAVAILFAVHVVLLVAQVAAAASTGSVAIAANALHIMVDTAVHLVALGGVWLATRPADPRHPYGYERYEALAALVIGMLLLVAMVFIVSSAVQGLIAPEPRRESVIGIAVMTGSAAAAGILALYLRGKARALRSRILSSEALHAGADALLSVGVVVAVWAGDVGWPQLDPLVALAVGAAVAWRGWGVVRGAADVLTDAAVVDTDAIHSLALAVPGVRDCHAVRSRGEAGHVRVDLHVHVAPELTIVEAHGIAEEVEARIRRLDPGITEVLVHLGAAPTSADTREATRAGVDGAGRDVREPGNR